MFCQCFFGPKPAAHAGHEGHGGGHFCLFNNAYKVNIGHFGATKLDGAIFWASGDLGDDFGDGTGEWLHLTFDPSVTPQQREAINVIMGHILPLKWGSTSVGEDKKIGWQASRDAAHATLDGGAAAEIVLKKNAGMSDEPIVIKNLRYMGAPRNDGFVLMQNEIQTLRQAPAGHEPFEFKGTNGFMITFDISSADVPAAK
jgi:hypothetical protein